jgi:hypothetical protein
VALAISCSVLLAVSYVAHRVVVGVIAVATLLTFVSLWFLLPIAGRDRANQPEPSSPNHGEVVPGG